MRSRNRWGLGTRRWVLAYGCHTASHVARPHDSFVCQSFEQILYGHRHGFAACLINTTRSWCICPPPTNHHLALLAVLVWTPVYILMRAGSFRQPLGRRQDQAGNVVRRSALPTAPQDTGQDAVIVISWWLRLVVQGLVFAIMIVRLPLFSLL